MSRHFQTSKTVDKNTTTTLRCCVGTATTVATPRIEKVGQTSQLVHERKNRKQVFLQPTYREI